MTLKTQKILIILILSLVCFDLLYVYLETSSFNAMYAASSLILFGTAWDALNKLEKQES